MYWNDRSGMEIRAKYPKEIEDPNQMTLLQVYGQHEYSREKGIITLSAGENIISYYAGPEKKYYILLFLDEKEEPEDFESGLVDIAQNVLQNLKDDNYIEQLPGLYERLTVQITLTAEQELASIYLNEIKRIIIHRLRDEGVVDKAELSAWLKDKYRRSFVDVEGLLVELIKKGFIKISSIKGENIPSILVYLTGDIMMFRAPPMWLLEKPDDFGLPEQYAKGYQDDSFEYFVEYKPTEEDSLNYLEVLLNPQIYEIICLLRKKFLSQIDLAKLENSKEEEAEGLLDQLIDNDIAVLLEDKANISYYGLKSDFVIDEFFPKYVMNIITTGYRDKVIAPPVLMEYLKILEDIHEELEL